MKRAREVRDKISGTGPQLTYERLMQFNQHCSAALTLMELFGREEMIPRSESRYYRALLRELRASASQPVLEYLNDKEIAIAAAASRERLKVEKQLLK